ncbi:MAG: hypothetical protein E8D44_13180 [Nitrospira sp.]|jgi:hypothetical protein|nr:MAG: hypothetical protein E8D44_13180 [Nitrospira sp.]
MIRLWLALILVLFVSPVHAADPPAMPLFGGGPGPSDSEWVKLGITDDYAYYASPGTIHHKGPLVQMWTLRDYTRIQTVAGKSLLSEKTKVEYDCAEGKSRFLASLEYSSHMGGKEPMYSNPNRPSEWFPALPGSVVHAEWKYVCGKWVKIGSSNIHTVYLDLQTVRHEGYLVKIWEVMDYMTIQKWGGSTFLSNKSQWEYNCLSRQYRVLGRYLYSGQMGNGEVVDSGTEDSDKWEPVRPSDWSQNKWKVACGEQ